LQWNANERDLLVLDQRLGIAAEKPISQ